MPETVSSTRKETNTVVKVYLSGPMSSVGPPDYNYPKFNKEAKRLRDEGYEVINPAEFHNGETGYPHWYFMRTDLPAVIECDYVYLLDDWECSKGATAEVFVAAMCNIPVFLEGESHKDARAVVVEEAKLVLEPKKIPDNVVSSTFFCCDAGIPRATCTCGKCDVSLQTV